MSVNPLDYFEEREWKLMYDEAARRQTPFLIVNLNMIRQNFEAMRRLFPYAKIHYAVKANPATEVVALLRDLGSNFDVASVYELDSLLKLGISPDRISYGNTIKKTADIRRAYECGVRLFATDSVEDVQNLAKFAPGSDVFFRVLVEGGQTSQWPLSRKFGCHPNMLIYEIVRARDLGLNPRGVSFHVGSQQYDIGAWDSALSQVRYVFDAASKKGVDLDLVNMGGGFPAHYMEAARPIDAYAQEITRLLSVNFGHDREIPEIIIEPGRSLVADSGMLVGEVVAVTRKDRRALVKWLYLDAGKFNGLMETLDESIKYPIYCEARGRDVRNFIVAGPTCDSVDIMYEKYRVPLPEKVAQGDRLYWFSTGAYTSSYSSVGFNGFPPIPTYFVGDSVLEQESTSFVATEDRTDESALVGAP